MLINGTALLRDDEAARKSISVARYIDDLSGRDAILEAMYMPTLNINGMWSGYTDEGVRIQVSFPAPLCP